MTWVAALSRPVEELIVVLTVPSLLLRRVLRREVVGRPRPSSYFSLKVWDEEYWCEERWYEDAIMRQTQVCGGVGVVRRLTNVVSRRGPSLRDAGALLLMMMKCRCVVGRGRSFV